MKKKLVENSDEFNISGGTGELDFSIDSLNLIENFSVSHCYRCSQCARSFYNPTDNNITKCPVCGTESLSRVGRHKVFFNYAKKDKM